MDIGDREEYQLTYGMQYGAADQWSHRGACVPRGDDEEMTIG